MTPLGKSRSDSGQAAVEAELTMPLAIFVVLGTLQLFMMLQARIIAQVAVYEGVRAGALNSGSCEAMTQAAIATLLPTITNTVDPDPNKVDDPTVFVDAYSKYVKNRYRKNEDGFNGIVVEFVRELPKNAPDPEDFNFDQPQNTDQIARLEARMIYWYHLRIPFADWLMGRMFLAYYGIMAFTGSNPLMPAQAQTNWKKEATLADEADWPGGALVQTMKAAAPQKQYVFPIKVNSVMRMMSPPAATYLNKKCMP